MWFPAEPKIVHYTAALFSYRGLQGLFNSLIIASVSTVLSAIMGTMMAYSLARFNTGGQHLAFWVLSQRFLPPVAFILPICVFGYHVGRFAPPVLTLGFGVVLVLFALTIFARGPGGHPIGAVATTVFGVMYGAGTLCFAYGLRYHNYAVGRSAGSALVLYPLVLTWISDTAAFFVGRSVGRHKLIPSVSPGKTVEGAVGALVVCAVASWCYAHWVLPHYAFLAMRPLIAVLLGVGLSVAVQLGDLAESLIKREAGLKDSSNLIPGHGGVLDRLDGLLFALPVAYLAFTFPHVLLPAIQ